MPVTTVNTPYGAFITSGKEKSGLSLYRARWGMVSHGRSWRAGDIVPVWHRKSSPPMLIPKSNGWGELLGSYDMTGKPLEVGCQASWAEVKALRELEKACSELRPIPLGIIEALANVSLSREPIEKA